MDLASEAPGVAHLVEVDTCWEKDVDLEVHHIDHLVGEVPDLEVDVPLAAVCQYTVQAGRVVFAFPVVGDASVLVGDSVFVDQRLR